MSSSQNERTLGGGRKEGEVLKNEQGQTRREGGRSKLGNLERTYFLNVPLGNVHFLAQSCQVDSGKVV